MIENSNEILKESWVSFQRYECKSGFIDIWNGSKSDDPNLESKSDDLNLESNSNGEMGTHKMYRLNGSGNWISDNMSSQSLDRLVKIMMDKCSASEIWNIVFTN